eukprot:TRINITY_DN6603_c0_g1_i4.p1 TRINITY_DN6603_c0_g1~~TRINITY_DN6603_c0_g1_i4.p1  ORF type:complete len:681 (+),score=237.15 TRINITY_DN6603_c0_g1_i4:384-2426(+)
MVRAHFKLGTIFAYGQTGCGKTFTMVGSNGELKGIIPNTFSHVFDSISTFGKERRFLLRCSYLEIYNEAIHDLLEYSPDRKLELKEDPQKGIYIKGLANVIVKSVQDIEQTMARGATNRHTAETNMNKDSSRSHCIFTIYIETAETKPDGNQLLRAGKLNLVDLAGSERQAKTQAEGIRLKEAAKINLSLSALGNVISALVDGKSSHIPYRDSKLTRLLQDSLGGNTKTLMIACVSPADYNYDETLSTLRYAARAKNIQNKPRINEDPKDALLREYEDEIKSLKEMLGKLAKGGMQMQQLQELDTARRILRRKSTVKSIEDLDGYSEDNDHENSSENGSSIYYKEQAENELEQRENELLVEKEQREKLEKLIGEYEQKLISGGKEFEKKQKEEQTRYKELKERYRKQRNNQRKLLEEQRKKDEEMELAEQKFYNIREELRDKDSLIKELIAKYKSELSEIRDLKRENQDEKELLLDTIREQNLDINFYQRVAEVLFTEEELERVQERARWNEEADEWVLQPFTLQYPQAELPKLPRIGNAPEVGAESERRPRGNRMAGSDGVAARDRRTQQRSGGESEDMGAPQTKTYYNQACNQSSKVKFSWDRLPNKCPGSEKSPKVAGGMGKYKNARLQPINQPLVNGDGKQWENPAVTRRQKYLSLIHICRCRRYAVCRSRWSPYH